MKKIRWGLMSATMKHRTITFLLIGILVFLISGCGSKSAVESVASSEMTEIAANPGRDDTEEAYESEAEAANDADGELKIITVGSDDARIKVGMVSGVGGINDHSFNQSAWDGLQSLHEEMGARVSYIETTNTDEFYDGLCTLAEMGCDICWGIGYNFADAVQEAAKAYPDTHFAIVDYEYDEIPSNVTCATFRAEESSFMVGYLAAAMSKTGKVGFIGGMEAEQISAFQYGYMEGARKADLDYGKTTEVVTEYLGSFTDEKLGKDTAEKMYEDGCDIIFHADGGAGTGVIEAAKNKNSYVIGVDGDQSYLAPENVLTSAVKKVGVVLSNIPVQYDMGEKIGGIAIEYGVSERAVGIPKDHPNIPDDLYEAVMKIEQDIIVNEIKVPENEQEYLDFMK